VIVKHPQVHLEKGLLFRTQLGRQALAHLFHILADRGDRIIEPLDLAINIVGALIRNRIKVRWREDDNACSDSDPGDPATPLKATSRA